jgi:hypothetical protein
LACRRQNADLPHALPGTWKLASVGGKSPASIQIDSWQVQFGGDGKWQFSGSLTGDNQGTQMSGAGTWVLQGNDMQYTAGDNKGTTGVNVEKGALVFSSDPVIRVNGKDPVETRYVRVNQ